MRLRLVTLALLGLGNLTLLRPAQAQITAAPTMINYQGRLATPSGNPVPDGTYSIRFSLWDAVSAGTEKWNQTIANIQVKNGTFAVLLNTNTAGLFHGNLWLETKIGSDAALAPRRQLVSVAYAMKANSVPDGSINTVALANNAVTTAKIADGNITAAKLVSGTLNPLAWLLSGNSATNPTNHFLGTTDAQPLVFRTSSTEKMRLLANGNLGIGTTTPSAVLHVKGGVNNVAVFAGDLSPYGVAPFETNLSTSTTHAWFAENSNRVFSVRGGGAGYFAGSVEMAGIKLPNGAAAGRVLTSDAVGVGSWNVLTSLLGNNSITNAMIQSMDYSKITNVPASGWNLTGNAGTTPPTHFLGTTDDQPLVFKSNNLRALQLQYLSLSRNGIISTGINVLGGSEINSISATAVGGTIAGGGGLYFGMDYPNQVLVDFGTVGGGFGNIAGATAATVAGGQRNEARGYSASLGGGYNNIANGDTATIAGGQHNIANSNKATVGGGLRNASGNFATVGGGADNTASGNYSTIGGGQANTASGIQAAIPGGQSNRAAGFGSFAAGLRAKANHDGAFVWSDSTGTDFTSTAANEFNVRADGGTRIFSNAAATTGVLLAAGSGSWSSASDRNLKTNFQHVDSLDVLEKLTAIPLTTWNYTANQNIRHMGVMAQDFYAAFGGLGLDDKHIDTVDADGVAFAAIQGLNRKLEASNAELKKENAELKMRLEALELAVQRLTAQPK